MNHKHLSEAATVALAVTLSWAGLAQAQGATEAPATAVETAPVPQSIVTSPAASAPAASASVVAPTPAPTADTATAPVPAEPTADVAPEPADGEYEGMVPPPGPGYGWGPGPDFEPGCSPGTDYDYGPGYGRGPGQGYGPGRAYGSAPPHHYGPWSRSGYRMSPYARHPRSRRGSFGTGRALDRDADGIISPDEAAAHHELMFMAFDLDGDGTITRAEFVRMRMRPSMSRGMGRPGLPGPHGHRLPDFEELDEDGDGQLSKPDFMQFGQQHFGEADLDGDGTVTVWEHRSIHR